MFVEVMRHVLYRRRVKVARAWRDAERRDIAERNAAFQRIVDQGVPDPAERRAGE